MWREHISQWQDSVSLKRFPELEGVASTDILIIGGGLAGILTAHELSRKGVRCTVVEGCRIGQGNTAGTTGKITSQHGFLYQKLIKNHDSEAASLYLKAQEQALDTYRRLSGVYDCDFQTRSNVVYTLSGRQKAELEMDALERIGYPARFCESENLNLPFSVDGAVEFPNQACFHPLKFLKGITEAITEKNHVSIFENTWIRSLRSWHNDGWEAVADKGTILADQVVFASHFPFYNGHGAYFMKMYQSRSYVISGTYQNSDRNLPDEMYVDESDNGLSFREAEGLLIIAGSGSRPGKAAGWDDLNHAADSFYKGWKTKYQWAAQDCMTLDGIPYIGPYYGTDGKKHGLWVAAGFNKWGMTGSMTAAQILSEQIYGMPGSAKNPYADLFRPARSILQGQLAVNGGEAVIHLIKPVVPRCRHMGCALAWNEEEALWQCPCHGSLYTKKGKCVEGPSKKNLF